jgi:hypothetical protein
MYVPIASLWLPILLSAVLIFVVSSIFHTVLPHHESDFDGVPDEEAVRAALGPLSIPPGDYVVPHPATKQERTSDEFKRKMAEGPVLFMTVWPSGQGSMGASLAQWFVYCLVVSIFAAYVASRALPAGADYLEVFRFAGVTAFAAYALALFQASIWFRRKWSTTLKSTFDGLIYALLTAGVFGWLWPVT